MVAVVNPDVEMGPLGMFVCAGFLALIACGVLVSGLHPRWRLGAKWRGGVLRSVFGSLAFSVGLLVMSIAMVVRGMLDQHGSFAGIVLWLFCGGAAALITGPVYDLIQNVRKR